MSDYRKKYFEDNKSNHGWYECNYCGEKLRKKDVQVDHVQPQARGGSNSSSNLVASCRHCNTQKGAKDDLQYELWKDDIMIKNEDRMDKALEKYENTGDNSDIIRELNRKTPYIKSKD